MKRKIESRRGGGRKGGGGGGEGGEGGGGGEAKIIESVWQNVTWVWSNRRAQMRC